MTAIPTIDQMRTLRTMCEAFNETVDKSAAELKEPAQQIRRAVGMLYTDRSVGVYFHPEKRAAAFGVEFKELPTEQRVYLLSALRKVAHCRDELADPQDSDWVKVAYSPMLRRTGELLNFFPGEYVAGLPNSPGPLQSMLTSGLVGAGLGYGAGWLGERLMPEKWEKGKLRRTLAMLGGSAGMTPGLIWGMTNRSMGNRFNDPDLLNDPPVPNFKEANDALEVQLGQRWKTAQQAFCDQWQQANQELERSFFGKEASVGAYGRIPAMPRMPSPLDVNVNALGQTLWEVGAQPQDAAMTMGAVHAAQQMPGGRGPGWVTPGQMARFATHMGGGYFSGALVGAALGKLTGLPDGAQNTLKRTGAYLGIIKAVVPELFGGG